MPQMPQQYAPFFQPPASPTSSANPFLKSTRSQMFTPISPSANPFLPPAAQQNQPTYSQSQVHSPISWQNQQQQQAQLPQQTLQDQGQTSFYPHQPIHSQTYPRPAADKSSILALYNNYPQLGNKPLEPVQAPSPAAAPITSPSAPAAPAPGNLNPFAASQTTPALAPGVAALTNQSRHVSNESVDFSGLMGGRHSPDAFSGLSASFRR
ncbi:hypothetical protein B0J11DRAFT_214257 [Dendryphion nanum]|uniref:Uncharacterized protein n=1 Tax=Dendryphion nanum TaxID=256645 RepID=A0A9P9E604_9PLEO|nr:hypothetical protein B0J11DRAFT_214257 [Dendryphion nanum]